MQRYKSKYRAPTVRDWEPFTAKDVRKVLIKILKKHGLEMHANQVSVKYTDKKKRHILVEAKFGHDGNDIDFSREYEKYGFARWRGFPKARFSSDIFWDFERELVDTVGPVTADWRVSKDIENTILEYLHNLPAGKCLVIDLEGKGRHRKFFLAHNKRHGGGHFWGSEVYYFDGWCGEGIEHEYNDPCFCWYKALELEEGYETRQINGEFVCGKVSILVPWVEDIEYGEKHGHNDYGDWWTDMGRGEHRFHLTDEGDMFFSFGVPTGARLVDYDEEKDPYLDSFARRFMESEYPHEYDDLPDDPELDKEYELCKSYNPEAFEYWKSYFCRKRCMIDAGAGCGSNCCKARLIEFVDFQYLDYKIPSVDGQPNRFDEEAESEE